MLRDLYYNLSPGGRRIVRQMYYFPSDFISLFNSKRDKLIPPKGKSNVGRGDFKRIGNKFYKDILFECDVKPNNKILDVGCGIGRISRTFVDYIKDDGAYFGFDIIEKDINWCVKKYEDYKFFDFKCYPVKNDLYLPNAEINPENFIFPYNDSSFDTAIVISVFTHMQIDALKNYLKQISRILKKGGTCYASFFLSENDHKYEFFPYVYDKFCLHNSKIKNANVAFDREFICTFAKSIGLDVLKDKKGWWSTGNIEQEFDFQDILILKKH